MPVEVKRSSLQRAWREADYHDFMWEFVTESAGDVVGVLTEAVEATNVAAGVHQGRGAFSERPDETGRGVGSLMLPDCERDELWWWFAELASRLEERGLSGTITAARMVSFPRWAYDRRRSGPVLTALLAFPLTAEALALPDQGRGSLGLSPEVASGLVEAAVAWARIEDADCYLQQGLFMRKLGDDRDVAQKAVTAALRFPLVSIWWVSSKSRKLRYAGIDGQGRLTLQVLEDQAPWRERWLRMLEVLRCFGREVDLASVRFLGLGTGTWQTTRPPVSPHRLETALEQGPRLRPDYVVDAYGAQVLTGRHLARAHDLAAWDIEELGQDRFLVTHPDLEAWFGGPAPDPDVVTRAREDFGSMILTPKDLGR